MAQELIHATRGPLVESIYRGDVAVVDSNGRLLYRVGSPREKVAFIRSSSKPIQAIPVVESGAVDHFGIAEEELAVFCASHNAEKEHVEAVLSVLKKIGLDASALQCGVHAPINPKAAKELVLAGEEPYEVHCNCSGKHSGMLTLARYHGWPVENYTEPDHPVQQAMLHTMADFAGLAPEDIVVGIDGCGVPVFGLSVYHMAYAWARLVDPHNMPAARQQACRRIAQAMLNHPSKVAGTGRFCSVFMSSTNRKFIGKSGAQGVYCAGILEEGIGIAVKMEDGNGRAASAVVVEVLRQLGKLTEAELQSLESFHTPVIKNHRSDIVGQSLPVFKLVTENPA